MPAAEQEAAGGAAETRRDPLGQRVGQGAEDDVGDARGHLCVAAHQRRGEFAVHDGARGGDDVDRPVAALVARDRGIGDVHEGVVDRRGRHRVGGVHGPGGLAVRSGEVTGHVAAVHHHGAVDHVGPFGHPVVLDDVAEAVLAVGYAADLLGHAPLGDIDQVLGGGCHGVVAVRVDEAGQPPLGHVQRADHGHEIAVGDLRRAVVGEDDLPDVLLRHPLALEPQRRDAQPLLEDVGGVAGQTTRRLGSRLCQMRAVGHEAHDLVSMEDRLQQRVLGDVATAPVRVVHDDDVARAVDVGAEFVDHPLHGELDRADLGGAELGLGAETALGVEQHAGEVQRFVEHRRVGGAHHGDAHLAAGRGQVVVDHRQRDLVGHQVGGHRTALRRRTQGGHRLTSTIRTPSTVRRTCVPDP